MLARYRMVRGARPADDPLPEGTRVDTRKHTRHCLRPTPEIVEQFLGTTTREAWERFRDAYVAIIEARFAEDPAPFDRIADQARHGDVYLGCSCPSAANPRVERCHTVLALLFMAEQYADLEVRLPSVGQ